MAKGDHPPGSEPFDVTLPEGFELGVHRSALEAAAKQAGWTIERDGALIVVRDVWTENEDHAAWLVATKVGLPLERVTVWAGLGVVRERGIGTCSMGPRPDDGCRCRYVRARPRHGAPLEPDRQL